MVLFAFKVVQCCPDKVLRYRFQLLSTNVLEGLNASMKHLTQRRIMERVKDRIETCPKRRVTVESNCNFSIPPRMIGEVSYGDVGKAANGGRLTLNDLFGAFHPSLAL